MSSLISFAQSSGLDLRMGIHISSDLMGRSGMDIFAFNVSRCVLEFQIDRIHNIFKEPRNRTSHLGSLEMRYILRHQVYNSKHTNFDLKAVLTARGVAKCMELIKKELFERHRYIFRQTTFKYFLDLPQPDGDPLVIHYLFLHEVQKEPNIEQQSKRLMFKFGETSMTFRQLGFCLITGFRVGPFVDLLHGEEGVPKNKGTDKYKSVFRARVFPVEVDASLRLSHIKDFIEGEEFDHISVEDGVKLCLLYLFLRGLMGRDLNTGVPEEVYKLIDDLNSWNSFAWGSYLWSYSYAQLFKIFEKIESYALDLIPFGDNGSLRYSCEGFLLPIKIWIWETFPKALDFVSQDKTKLPSMNAWQKKSKRIDWK